ncbi:MAG: Tim44/TimA family putative adaptor protein [Hyphomicrobiaceae bacterium]
MDGKIDIFTLLFLVLAVIIVLRLRSVLGRKSSEDDARIERYKAEQRARAAAAQGQDKVVTLPRRDRPDAAPDKQGGVAATAEIEEKVRTMASGNEPLADGMIAIARADRNFDPEHFLVGARQAYEMIVTAFAEGNRKTLRNLLSKDVFDGFSTALSERDSRGEQIDQSFVGINKADIVEAELKGNTAHLTVRFASELISATRDRSGTVLAGDPKRIKEVIDIWTFAREVTSRDPNWKLVATQAPG